ncbi:hypothetical protein IM676_09450 [Anabaenopsis elenkinii CCIBt3563]|uniref:Uncharacterized protein n=1 Tax=Anabaenopsis elenkinii CCIBt3563 TaxID=2779889 RepID=A0A7S6U5G5_9CYAN|nr:hypothetical protein IM676_09450 [Anabaenopsis elenkinii CCIBt3563]
MNRLLVAVAKGANRLITPQKRSLNSWSSDRPKARDIHGRICTSEHCHQAKFL